MSCERFNRLLGLHIKFLKVECFLLWMCLNTLMSSSCSRILFLSRFSVLQACFPDNCGISFSLSNASMISHVLPRHFPMRKTEFSVTLEPRAAIDPLQILFRCSMWRSQEIFFPGLPWVLIVRHHFSCAAIHGVNVKFSCASMTNASIE